MNTHLIARFLSRYLITWINAMRKNPKATGKKTLKVLLAIIIILAVSSITIFAYNIYQNKHNPNIAAEMANYDISFEEQENNFLNDVYCKINIKVPNVKVNYIYVETNNESFTNYCKDYVPADGTILVDKVCMSYEDYENLKIKKLTIEGLDSTGGKFKVKINYDLSTVKYLDPETGKWLSIE